MNNYLIDINNILDILIKFHINKIHKKHVKLICNMISIVLTKQLQH